jgi:hypothetical protein
MHCGREREKGKDRERGMEREFKRETTGFEIEGKP